MRKKIKVSKYRKAPVDESGRKFIIRTRCCLAKAHTPTAICGECEKENSTLIIFYEDKVKNPIHIKNDRVGEESKSQKWNSIDGE